MKEGAATWSILQKSRGSDTCLVIGNGPSLRNVQREFLDKYDSLGSNRIYLKFSPTFYVSVNPLVIEQCIDDIIHLDSAAKFIGGGFAARVPGAYELISRPMPHFAREPWNGIYEGFTVTYVCLQIAFFMGYQTVLLVGVDHRFLFEGAPNQEKVLQGDDPNHFDPNYFKGMRWNNPDLERSALAYEMARTVFEASGRRIFNLTEGTALEVFEKGNIDEW